MAYLNENYLKLKAGYLFPEIARRVKAFTEANPEAAKRLIRCGIGDVTESLPEAVRAQLEVARLSDAGELELVLDDGAVVRFGLVEDVPAKLAATQGVLEQVVRECMDVVDVREPSRATVSRVEGCSTPAPTLEDARSTAAEDDEDGSATSADSSAASGSDTSDEGAATDGSTEVDG